MNGIFSLNILLNYVFYRELRFIILKLEIKLIKITVENIISNILRKIKPNILNTKNKELTFKEI